jgi:uncharacterized membrane protein YbhN (UPF0104 family)
MDVRTRRPIAFAAVTAIVVAGAAAWFASGAFRHALADAGHADPRRAYLAACAFGASVAATACAWRTAFGAVGARFGVLDACARYGLGSLVNTFVPARAGDAARVALFSRGLDGGRERLLTAAGAVAAIAAIRGVVQAGVILTGSLLGAVPRWPVAALLGAVVLVVLLAYVLRRRLRLAVFDHLLEAGVALVRRPACAARVAGWVVAAALARVCAAAAVAWALHAPSPLVSAFVITAALEVTGLLPLTPGNVGITSGAITIALASSGVAFSTALAVGIAFHAVESLASVVIGLGALPLVLRPGLVSVPAVRVAAAGLVALVGTIGLGLLTQLT